MVEGGVIDYTTKFGVTGYNIANGTKKWNTKSTGYFKRGGSKGGGAFWDPGLPTRANFLLFSIYPGCHSIKIYEHYRF